MAFTFPKPLVIPSDAVPSLRWGIIGPGEIAEIFADAVLKHTTQQIVAVASRTAGKAEKFAIERNISHTMSTYEDLMTHGEVDVVYVATPHHLHTPIALQAIAAGKHVLIEKPLATNPEDVAKIADAARQANVLVMEALWSRYIPQTSIIRQLIAEGHIGQPTYVISDLGFPITDVSRIMDTASGGGLLDLGIYNFALASQVLGNAESVHATGTLTTTGVDENTTSVLTYASGARAVATTSITALTPTFGSVVGEKGRIDIHAPFFVPSGLSLYSAEFNEAPLATWRDETGVVGHEGLSYQASALAKYVSEGLLDSPERPLSEVMSDISLIQQARHQIGAYLDDETKP